MNSTPPQKLGAMTAGERKAVGGLAAIFGVRMLGLFLVLPVFSLYGGELDGATPTLIGLAIGIYGLSQAILQIPVGTASDRFGRRPVIVLGLLVFIVGSIVAALSDTIYGVIAGRALQGCGAIAAAVMALAADLTRDSQRTKAMAIIGMSIGGSFLLALMLGPLVAAWGGLSSIFWFTAALALLAVGLLYGVVPRSDENMPHRPDEAKVSYRQALLQPDLLRLNLGIFVLHAVLTAGFVAMPIVLRDRLGLAQADHWQVYVPVLLLSVVAMVPVVGFGERRKIMHRVLPWVVLALLVAELGLTTAAFASPMLILASLWLYFAAFNTLEASLPSLVSRVAPPRIKGTALGIYSTAQFLGAFTGGVSGGALYGHYGIPGVFIAAAAASAVWFAFAFGMKPHVEKD